MSVVSCKGCGGIFAFLPRDLCAGCIDRREESFQAVRDFLRDHPGASVIAACTKTGVEERLVAEFIREGRLRFADHSGSETVQEQLAKEALRARLAGELAAHQGAGAVAPRPASEPQPRRSGMRSRLP